MVFYLRATYLLQFLAASNLLLALFLPWHQDTHSAASMIVETLPNFLWRFNPINIFSNPLWMVMLLVPITALGIVRGLMGLFESKRVDWHIITRRMCYLAIIPLIWFHGLALELGYDRIQYGYWLSAWAAICLISLVFVETTVTWTTVEQAREKVVICPNCSFENDFDNRRCDNCGELLFHHSK